MRTFISINFLAVFIFAAAASSAQERWSGEWTMVSMSLNVEVESWGEHCGPKPVSYTSKKARPVEIAVEGRHLIFSKGGMRTDRCGSPNPRLKTISQMATSGVWSRVCQTDKDDPKFERGEYSLLARGQDTLEYTAKSEFDWNLKGDHCIARSTEKRVYTRDESASGGADKSGGAAGLDEVDPACEETGELRRILVQPKVVQLGPGERMCFKVSALDDNGCKKEVRASWSVKQDDRFANDLISKGGCFRAGDNAAVSEGLYHVEARVEGKVDSAQVTVVFPDLGELLAARLAPIEELPQADGGAPTTPEPSLSLIPLNPKPPADQGRDRAPGISKRAIFIVVCLVAAAAVGAILVVLLKRGKKRIHREDLASTSSSRTATGMVCPKCNRGYDSSARFCPHDSEKLLPYAEWRGRTQSTDKNA